MDFYGYLRVKQDKKIIGIVLVRNEDRFIQSVLTNIIDFCDEIIVADHCSTDETPKIVNECRQRFGTILYEPIAHPTESHELIRGYAGQPVWIFGVDGDELYDPLGLAKLKEKILAGEFDSYWMIFGNVLNCIQLNEYQKNAQGYMAPPCRSMTKLYNFQMIDDWGGKCPERLHGGKIDFKRGFQTMQRFELYKEMDWEESDFRCLHLCFLRRSSLESESQGHVARKNISDINSEGVLKKTLSFVKRLFGKNDFKPQWKHEKYCRGKLVTKNISSFLQ